MTITEFLLARIAADEGDANYLANVGVQGVQYGSVNGTLSSVIEIVRADAAAKRRIVELHVAAEPDQWEPERWACRLCQWDICCDNPKQDYHDGAGVFPCETLRALAAVYADHPDYAPAWRP